MKNAFALVEMMIVVAIVGILAAIIIPNALRARERTRNNGSVEKTEKIYQHNGHTFIHDPNCGCTKYGKL